MTGSFAGVGTLLCDGDGTLFPSEEPAYAASEDVMNRLLEELGAGARYSAAEQQQLTNGKNFRAAAQQLAAALDRPLPPPTLERWVAREKDVVTAHLRTALRPDPDVLGPVAMLARELTLAAVTSSARSRLDACLEVTGLAPLFPPQRRFSAEDSLPVPASKPDPAVYAEAARSLGCTPADAVAVEDSVNGVRSAVGAGFPAIGMLVFVPAGERDARADALRAAGAGPVVASWAELHEVLSRAGRAAG